MNFLHYPVMNKEIIQIFSQTAKKLFVDCTLGMGGHTYLLLEHFKGSCVFAIDCDQKSIDQAKKNLLKFSSRVSFFKINFLELFEKLPLEGESISGILIDPGISTFQLKHGSLKEDYSEFPHQRE